jgi:uncharacterized damage-inducible protein DinB
MTSDYLRLLYDYHYWANRRVFNCIANLTPEQFVQPLDYSVGSIRNQVVHMMSAEWIWFARIQGESPDHMLNPDDYPTPKAVQAAWAKIEAHNRAFLNTLTDERLEQTFAYHTTRRIPFEDKIGNILFHAANHATDHRAQILAMLHTFGVQGVEQDLIFYLREQR